METTFKVIEKKRNFLASLSNGKVFLILLVFLVATFLLLYFVSSLSGILLTFLFATVAIGLKYLSINRYRLNGNRDFLEIGYLKLIDDKIEVNNKPITSTKIDFLFSGKRGASFDGREISNGISEFKFDDQELKILIESEEQIENLKITFRKLYDKGQSLIEKDIRTDIRLIELNPKFEWEQLDKITGANSKHKI